MGKGRKDIPLLEKFMLPPDDYEIFKFGGSSLKDEERGIQTNEWSGMGRRQGKRT